VSPCWMGSWGRNGEPRRVGGVWTRKIGATGGRGGGRVRVNNQQAWC
jgi:hypothetical protein